MTGVHGELPPELRQLALSVLDRLDPAVRLAAARALAGGAGKCEQVWCPVCALAALLAGERHPLLTVVAEHGVALMTVVRAMVDSDGATDGPGPPDPSAPHRPPPEDEPPPSGPGRYQPIAVTIDE